MVARHLNGSDPSSCSGSVTIFDPFQSSSFSNSSGRSLQVNMTSCSDTLTTGAGFFLDISIGRPPSHKAPILCDMVLPVKAGLSRRDGDHQSRLSQTLWWPPVSSGQGHCHFRFLRHAPTIMAADNTAFELAALQWTLDLTMPKKHRPAAG